jgi:hypothetical protein
MKSRPTFLALLSTMILLSCRSAGTGGGQISTSSIPLAGTELFPRQIAGFKRGDSTTYGDINSGISYRYHHPSGALIDVYRYPIAVGLVCRSQCLRGIVDDEITGFKTDLPLYIRNGAMDSAVVVGASQEELPSSSWLKVGRHLELRVFRGGVWNWSHVWIFGGDGIRIKVRATYPVDKPQPDYRAVISDLLNQAAPPFTCRGAPAEGESIQISTRQTFNRQRLADRVLFALDSLGFERSFVGPDVGHWAAAPRFSSRTVGDLQESELGLGIAVRMTEVNDSIDLVVMGRTLCQGGGKAESPLAMSALLRLAAVITERK